MQKMLFVHRWGGVALALFMALWLGSGLLIVVTGTPSVDRATQLAHASQLAPAGDWLDPAQAWAHSGAKGPLPGEARLLRIADEPYWLIRLESGESLALDARSGAPHYFGADEAVKIVNAWRDAPGEAEEEANVLYLGQSAAPVYLRNAQGLGPFHDLALDDGKSTEILVSTRTGEVVAASSAVSRALYYASSWIHLLHPLDFLGESRRVVLAALAATAFIAALAGLVIGFIRWRPGLFGRPTYSGKRHQPYRKPSLAIHFWVGLTGGVFATLWAFSGLMTANPGEALFSPANASNRELAIFAGAEKETAPLDFRGVNVGGLSEIVWRRLGDKTVAYGLTAEGVRRPLAGAPDHFDNAVLQAAAQRLAGPNALGAVETLGDYDSYYYPSRRQSALDRPLPVLRVDLQDAAATHLYLDARDGRLLLKQDASRRAYRWLFSAIHHWDVIWLVAGKPAWYAWTLTFISLGLALAVTAVVLAWRRLYATFAAFRVAREQRAAQVNAAE